jgi:anti-anti-sigma factor
VDGEQDGRDDPGAVSGHFSAEVVEGSPPTVALTGELDLATAPRLAQALERVPGDVVLDCAELSFVDSSGLSVIVDAHRRRARAGHRLSLRGLSASIYQTFEITGLHRELDLTPAAPG